MVQKLIFKNAFQDAGLFLYLTLDLKGSTT